MTDEEELSSQVQSGSKFKLNEQLEKVAFKIASQVYPNNLDRISQLVDNQLSGLKERDAESVANRVSELVKARIQMRVDGVKPTL